MCIVGSVNENNGAPAPDGREETSFAQLSGSATTGPVDAQTEHLDGMGSACLLAMDSAGKPDATNDAANRWVPV